MRLEDFLKKEGYKNYKENLETLFQRAKKSVYEIIKDKGATNWGIAACGTKIITSILRSENSILPLSTLIEDYYEINDVCLSIPSIVNRTGIEKMIRLDLSKEEIGLLKNSANQIKEILKKIKF